MVATAGKEAGGFVLLLGTISVLLKFSVTLVFVQPLFKAGAVVAAVLG